jgi:hypothetical protein
MWIWHDPGAHHTGTNPSAAQEGGLGRLGCRMASGRNSTRRVDVISKGWAREFDDPIPLPRGRQLVTLQDAGNYITKLPKAEHAAAEWQAAMQALILVAESGGPTMLARIGIMRALNYGKPDPTIVPRRKRAKARSMTFAPPGSCGGAS